MSNGTAIENFEAYVYARDNGHLEFIKKAKMCEDFFAGEQWEEAIKLRLQAQKKPVLTFNKTLSTVATILGEQLSNRADIAYLPSNGGNPETADALNVVFLQIQANNDIVWHESEVFADGVITSRGFFDVRLDFDDHMKGEVRVTHLNPVNVVIDPDAESYDPDDWNEVFVTKWMDLDSIAEMYGKEHVKVLEHRAESSLPLGFDSIDRLQNTFSGPDRIVDQVGSQDNQPIRRRYRVIERQYRKYGKIKVFVDPFTGDTREAPAGWSPQKVNQFAAEIGVEVVDKFAKRIRWTVSVDDVLLFDEWSPYTSFTIVPYFPYFRRGRTIGVVENLVSPQELYNKVRSQILHVINTTSNSGWKLRQNSLRNMTVEELMQRGADTGLVLELNDPSDAEKITPNPIPTGLDRVGFEANEDMKDISGVSDSLRGFDRADVAARAIEAKQQVGSLNFAKPLDNLAKTRRILARVVLNLVQQYYTEERLIQITGNRLTAQSQEVTVNEAVPTGEIDGETGEPVVEIKNDLTLGEYSVRVTSVPHRESLQQGAFQQVLEMRREGIPVPDDVLVELSALPNKGEVAQRIKELQGGGETTPEQQQLAQLEVAAKEAEIQQMQAEAQERQANAQLRLVKAQLDQIEAEQAQQGQNDPQLAKVQGELEIKRQQLELETQELQKKLEILEKEFELKQETARRQLLLERAMRAEQLDIQRTQAEGQVAVQMERADNDREVAEKKVEADARVKAKQAAASGRGEVSSGGRSKDAGKSSGS